MSRVFQPWTWWEKEKMRFGVLFREKSRRGPRRSHQADQANQKMNTYLSSIQPKTLATLFHIMVCQAQDLCFERCVKHLHQDLYLT